MAAGSPVSGTTTTPGQAPAGTAGAGQAPPLTPPVAPSLLNGGGTPGTTTPPTTGAGSAAAAGALGTGQPGAQGASPWYASLPQDVVTDKVKRYATIEEFAKGFNEAQTAIGKKGLILPEPDATPEAWGKVWDGLGRPPKPEDYKVTPPDGFTLKTEDVAAFAVKAHAAGLTQKQYETVMGEHMRHEMTKFNEAQTAAAQAQVDLSRQTMEALTKEFGSATDGKLQKVAAVFRRPDHAGLADLLTQAGVANHPVLVRAMIRYADAVSEDTAVGQAAAQAGIDQQIAALTKSPAYQNGAHPEHNKVFQQIQQLVSAKHRSMGAPV